jgi:prefoldin subunit 5
VEKKEVKDLADRLKDLKDTIKQLQTSLSVLEKNINNLVLSNQHRKKRERLIKKGDHLNEKTTERQSDWKN